MNWNLLTTAALCALIALIVIALVSIYWLRLPPLYSNETNSIVPLTMSPETGEVQEVPFEVEEVVNGLEVPWGIVFTSPIRTLVSERPGRIRVIENNTLRAEPLHTFSEVSTGGEEGLMSLALHPEYARNKFVYASYAHERGSELFVKVVRFVDAGSSAQNITTIIDDIPAARYHAGCELGFGPDGKLYITTGDATDRNLAQDMDSLAGKILRVNDDGSVPNDNPFPNSAIWSYGHRNPQGMWWDKDGNLYSTEHGPSGFDGPGGGDEINRIVKGGNYGWPLVSHEHTREGTIAPIALYTPAEAPGSALVYSGGVFPQFKGNIFFGALRGEGLWRVQIDANNPDAVLGQEKLFDGEYGRIREVTEGPDGFIYFSTSNRDGRGSVSLGDDRIFRLIPSAE